MRVKGLGFTQSDMPTANEWNVLHVLAHEVAHHLRNHLINPHPDKSQRDLELEADETAGYLLYLLGAPNLTIAQRALEGSDVPETGSYTHPPRSQRLNAFRTGWNKASAKFPQPGPATQNTTPVNPISPVPNESQAAYTDAIAGTFVFVQGGSFDMGCPTVQQGCADRDKPAHQVTLNSFYIGQYEVTQAQWRELMGSNPSRFSGCDQCPVENVSWDDVQTFLKRLNALSGQNYRLPTEAEWEFAARGGNRSNGYQYAGGHSLTEVGWYLENSGGKTHAVGGKSPNELGLYDMSGNVLEWCQDWFGNYPSSAQTNPKGPATGTHRFRRGGSWVSESGYCRVSRRYYDLPDYRNFYLGFRLAKTP
jgi:formylglycine-generating enzyme required for sulfatase activity